jgi:hypothetical protein
VISRIGKAAFLAFLLGLLVGLGTWASHSRILLDYAFLRIPEYSNPWFIFFNNLFALFIVLFGGAIFSLAEIKSYEVYPEKLYRFLEKLSSPLDTLFAVFDRTILQMRDPYKAVYFILYALPILVLSLNIAFFVALFLNLVFFMGISAEHALGMFVFFMFPLGILEFSVLTVACLRSLNFAGRITPQIRKKKLESMKKECRGFLKSRREWALFALLSILLLLGAFYEAGMV